MTERSTEQRTTRPGPARKPAETPARPPLAERISQRLSRSEEPGAARPAGGGRTPRRARLRLTRIDPWSVMKTSFLLSIAFAIVTVVSVAMVWAVLGGAGVWDSINATVSDVVPVYVGVSSTSPTVTVTANVATVVSRSLQLSVTVYEGVVS